MISTLCASLSQDPVQMAGILHAFTNIAVGRVAPTLLESTVMCGQLVGFDGMADVTLQKHSTLIKVGTTIKTINDKTVRGVHAWRCVSEHAHPVKTPRKERSFFDP